MPPFSRLIKLRSVLLLIVACVLQNAVIQLVRSDLSEGYTIQIGDLRWGDPNAEQNVVTKLSNGPNQQGWSKLVNAKWHDSARRFFHAGPPLPQSQNASAAGQGDQDLIKVEFQQLATANYNMSQWITGTGKIEASMWMLLFLCMDTSSCQEGYFVPIVSIPKEQQQYTYAGLYLNLTHNLIVNAIPYFIQTLSPVQILQLPIEDDSDLSNVDIFLHNAVPQCANSTVVIRSILDASYGLVPGSACIKFSQDEQLNLLVLLAQYPANYSRVDLPTFLNESLNTELWEHRQLFEDCSTAMVMSEYKGYVKLCDPNSTICILAYKMPNATCSGVDYLRFLQNVTSMSKSCTYDNAGTPTPLNFTALLQRSWTNVSCTDQCKELAVNVYNSESFDHLLFSPQSNTSDFSQAPNMAHPRTCIKNLSSVITSETDTFKIRARANLKSFIAEHSLAFTMAQGPATELGNFLSLLVSTAISVILGISGSFTNFLLKKICRRRPLHLDSGRGRVRKVIKVLFQTLCNMVLSFLSFLPVLYLAWSELKREKPFSTWDLASEDQNIYSPIEDIQLQVVYLLSATSQYRSHFIRVSVGVACGSCLLVGQSTAWRLMEVFDRYTLLQKYDSIQDSKRPNITEEDRETSYARALKAIDMTDAKELTIKAKLSPHKKVQELTLQVLTGLSERTGPAETADSQLLLAHIGRSA